MSGLVPWEVQEIRTAQDLDLFKQLVQETGESAIDTETDGLHWAIGHRPFMATFAAEETMAWATYSPEVARQILDFMEEEGHNQVYHNAKFDLHMLREWTGWVPTDGYMDFPFDDTMQGFRLQFPQTGAALKIGSGRFVDTSIDVDGPQRLVKKWIADNTKRERINGKWVVTHEPTYKEVPKELMLPYATQDAWLTIQSFHGLQADLEQRDESMKALYEREVQLVGLLIHAEQYGWPVSGDRLMEYLQQCHEEFTSRYAELNERWGHYFPDTVIQGVAYPNTVNLGSTAQLRKIIYEILGEPVKHMTDSGKNAATDESALADMNDREAADLIFLCRKWKKAKDKCTELLKFRSKHGAVHSNLKPDRAKTGRMSSTDPALQNCNVYKADRPYTHIRDVFRPKPGTEWLLADYSQIEMRLMAHYSQDPNLLDAIINGHDMHSMTASRMYGLEVPPGDDCDKAQKKMRSFGKVMNFTLIYGGGKRRITEALMYGSAQNDPVSAEDARAALRQFNPFVSERLLDSPFAPLAAQLYDTYKREFPTITDFVKQVQNVVVWRSKNEGMGYVKNVFGRITPVGVEATHKAVNYIVQGTAADLMKSAMVNAWRATEKYCLANGLVPWVDVHLFMSIHDELIWATPVGHAQALARFIRETLETWPQFSVPIVADFAFVAEDQSWAKKKGILVA